MKRKVLLIMLLALFLISAVAGAETYFTEEEEAPIISAAQTHQTAVVKSFSSYQELFSGENLIARSGEGDTQTGSLSITKVYEEDPTKSFSFTVSLSNDEISSKYGADCKITSNFSLKSGDVRTFTDIPYGTAFTIVENEENYTVEYTDSSGSGTQSATKFTGIINESERTITVTNISKYASLKAHIFFYGTHFSSLPKSDGKTQYVYPGSKISMQVRLTALDADAPMPSGAIYDGEGNKVFIKTISLSSSLVPKAAEYLSASLNFDLTDNLQDLLSEGQNSRTFTYIISHMPSEQDNEYDFINYNADLGDKSSGKEVYVTLELNRNSQTGELSFSELYRQNNSRKFPSSADFQSEAIFIDEYLSSVVAMAVSGEAGTKSTDTFQLYPTFLSDEAPLSGWYFYCYGKKSQDEEAAWGTIASSSYGEVSYTVSAGGGIYIYGVPNGALYRFDSYTLSAEYTPAYSVKAYDADNLAYSVNEMGIIKADNNGNNRIVCNVTYSNRGKPKNIVYDGIFPEKLQILKKGALSGTGFANLLFPGSVTVSSEALSELDFDSVTFASDQCTIAEDAFGDYKAFLLRAPSSLKIGTGEDAVNVEYFCLKHGIFYEELK